MKKRLIPVSIVLGALLVFPRHADAGDTATSEMAERDEVSLTMGSFHSCALLSSETVMCWGSNDRGQASAPSSLRSPRQLSAGDSHTCALDEGGVKCWGWNEEGQTNVPDELGPVRQISAGGWHTCALEDQGTVKCWGWNKVGQTTALPTLRNPRQISAGTFHTCALDDDGVKCWGWEKDGRTTVPRLRNPRQISAGGDHTCALDEDGVKCWPMNEERQKELTSMRHPLQISSGWKHSCALGEGGVKCSGASEKGQTSVPSFSPIGLIVPYSFTLNTLDQYLKNISHSFYVEKARFLRKAAEETGNGNRRLFIANSVRSLLEESPSARGDEIRAGFAKSLKKYNASSRIKSLLDFAASPELVRSSLKLSSEAVRVLGAQLGVGTSAVSFAPLKMSLAQALAAADPATALPEVFKEWESLSPRLDIAMQNRSSRPFLLILTEQMEFLRRGGKR